MTRRLQEEIKDLMNCNKENNGIWVRVDDDMTQFDAFIKGPEGTPYATGEFKLKVELPPDFPIKPPHVRFITDIWHPNISSVTGYICLDVLNENWVGSMTLRAVLLSVQNLLHNPVPEDAQDPVVGAQALRSSNIFERTAVMWTGFYAHGKHFDKELAMILMQVEDMGVSSNQAIIALSSNDWDVDLALGDVFN